MPPKHGKATPRSSQRAPSTLAPSTFAGETQAPSSVASGSSRSSLKRPITYRSSFQQKKARFLSTPPETPTAPIASTSAAPSVLPDATASQQLKRKFPDDFRIEQAASKKLKFTRSLEKVAVGMKVVAGKEVPAAKSVQSEPQAVPSIGAQSRTNDKVAAPDYNDTLAQEMERNEIKNVPVEDFVRLALPTAYNRFTSPPEDVDQSIYKASLDAYLSLCTQTSATSDNQAVAFRNIIRTVNGIAGGEVMCIFGRKTDGVPPAGNVAVNALKQKPNACIVSDKFHKKSPMKAVEVPYEDVLVPIYFSGTAPSKRGEDDQVNVSRFPHPKSNKATQTPESTAPAIVSGRESLARFAVDVLSASCVRQHTFGLLIEHKRVCVCYFDRGGAIISTPIDLAAEARTLKEKAEQRKRDEEERRTSAGKPKKPKTDADGLVFFRVLGTLLKSDREGWGFIPQFCIQSLRWPTKGSTFKLTLQAPGHLPTEPPRSVEYSGCVSELQRLSPPKLRDFAGRGTQVYALPKSQGVLKLSWQPVDRHSEATMLYEALQADVAGVPRVLAFGVVRRLADSESIRSKIAKLASLPAGADRELRAIVMDLQVDTLEKFRIKENPVEFLRVIRDLLTTHRSLARDAYILHRDINFSNLGYTESPAVRFKAVEKGPAAISSSRDPKSKHDSMQTPPTPPQSSTPAKAFDAFLIDLDFAEYWFDCSDERKRLYRDQLSVVKASDIANPASSLPDAAATPTHDVALAELLSRSAASNAAPEEIIHTLDLRTVAIENLPDGFDDETDSDGSGVDEDGLDSESSWGEDSEGIGPNAKTRRPPTWNEKTASTAGIEKDSRLQSQFDSSALVSPGDYFLYRYDLESFFWSMWWLILHLDPQIKAKLLSGDRIRDWSSTSTVLNRRAKLGFLIIDSPKLIPRLVKMVWGKGPLAEKMLNFLRDITTIFRLGHQALDPQLNTTISVGDLPSACGHITYEHFIKILDQACK